jgi:hypothetical protein
MTMCRPLGAHVLDGHLELVSGELPRVCAVDLAQLLQDIPRGRMPEGVGAKVDRVVGLSGNGRQSAAAQLSDALATNEMPVAEYGVPETSQFLGPRLGCRVSQPLTYGIDLAALCMNPSSP